MSDRVVHVIGAGLAGLSAAVRLAAAGERVVLYEAAKAAGGRARSYHDATLDLEIDNGNHLLLSGNRSALAYVDLIGGGGALTMSRTAIFDFADLASGARWRLRPNEGRIPWWIFDRARRVPGTSWRDYLAIGALLRAPPHATIGETMRCDGPLWTRLWHPVLLAALNTEPEIAAAGLAAPILRETLGAGGRACRPVVATGGLSAAFVDPAMSFLRERGAEIRLGARLRTISHEGQRVGSLGFGDAEVYVGERDGVVLATPASQVEALLPEIEVPDAFRAIVNAHFRVAPPPGLPPVTGMLGSLSEWLFAFPDRLSVTISAADRLLDTARDELARTVWGEVAALTRLPVDPMPPWQVVKERRATFAATPAQARRRPPAATLHRNLVLAGDWTATGLPATIEGAIRSGEMAASLLQSGDAVSVRGMSKVRA